MFHADDGRYFNMERLKAAAHETVSSSSLIQRCVAGDLDAARALSLGFWPFTRDFEVAIDNRANSAGLPREPLNVKFGQSTTRRTLIESARTIKRLADSEIVGVFEGARENLQEMQKDEKRHSHHWRADAKRLGLTEAELDSQVTTPEVQALTDATRVESLVAFFAVLASTEFIAEELGDTLAHARAYTDLFSNTRAIWMEVHTIPHDGEPSHEEIVLDFARAYQPPKADGSEEDATDIEALVIKGIRMFGVAADAVEARYAAMRIAAE
ncbi:MAG: hypothetical protein JO019_01725 [Candidatus Kaiserbacteria bacterium]|nr:hypothetical protein [Candidatus Kaiserbacteria bacterium]